ncbi:RNA polymerase I associated factor, A49-like protein [Elsinoe ampelina]|uniref:RNA polymerase I associated factor, A49-like protein n=1 Tax=Elsinoe ampelina TaxID=302913 RepID=A0A6A6GK61_9PEZI|nr:RNA polymerase I associated factor, A49-like protein [Elsinoe ampelina]
MAEKEKKRKRASTEGVKSNKRRSIDSDAGEIRVKLDTQVGKLHPVIATTAGIQLKPLSFDAYSHGISTSAHSQSLLLQTSEHPLLDYTARTNDDGTLAHYVGIYDPAEKVVRLLPAHAASIRSTLRSEAAEVQAQNESAARSRLKQREELGLEFGTKKAKKAIASKTVNAITGDSAKGVEQAILGDVGDAATAAPAKSERDDEILKAKPIPKPNLEAESPEKVYPITQMIHPGDLRSLTVKDWQDKVKAGTEVQLSSRFVAHRLQKVVAKDNIQMLKALKYLLLLLEFVGVLKPGRSGRKVPQNDQLKSQLSSWPETLVDNVRRKFAQGGELNKWHVDNLMTHIAAISLYIDGQRTDTHDLREDLQMENKQMSQYFSELGCKIRAPTEKEYPEFKISNKAQAAQRKVAVLKIPLEFPKTRNPPRRR